MVNSRKGRKQSAEHIAKRVAAIKAARLANPEREDARKKAARAGLKRWHTDPQNAAAFSKRSSERMKRRHADPEWQKMMNERTSEAMRKMWEKHRDEMTAYAVKRYQRMADSGTGICSAESEARKREAAKWIMKRAQDALRAETHYEQVFAEVQEQLRMEMPYDGPQNDSDYFDYLKKLGEATGAHPRLLEISNNFMSEAIPRFSREWQRRKETAGAS